ncbi:ABC transporter substrate-binding protein [Streptomyces sp. NPDC001982]|uniref:ABC transporter substrate-binding protein n=1 Tax=unclassified Streptomyces TaxID=2593676 RepID=UPI00331F781E
MISKSWQAAAVLGVLALGLTACGKDAAPSAGDSLTGEPLKVVQLVAFPNDPSTGKAGVDAAVEAINKAGGVGGRPIEIEYCEGPDVNKTQQCARDAVADKSVLAAVNNLDAFGGFSPIASEGGLPGVGILPINDADFVCKNCFFVTPGSLSAAGSAGLLHDVLGSKHIAGAYIDVPSAQGRNRLVKEGVLAPRGLDFAASVPVPPTATDVGPIIAALPGDVDGLYISSTRDQTAKIILQARKSGAKYPIAVPALTISAAALNELVGKQGTDIYVASPFNTDSDGYESYQKEMDAIGKAGSPEDHAIALNGWVAVHLFADAVEKAGADNVTRESLTAALKATSDYDTGGLTPPLDWTKPQTAMGGSLSAVTNLSLMAYKFNADTGKLDPVGDQTFLDIFGAGS